jgi:hypothetical protein
MLLPIELHVCSKAVCSKASLQKSAPSPLFTLLTLTGHEAEMLQLYPFQHVEQLECLVSRTDLIHFLEWALQQSYSPALTSEEKLQLLDIAWNVQQLLWAEE